MARRLQNQFLQAQAPVAPTSLGPAPLGSTHRATPSALTASPLTASSLTSSPLSWSLQNTQLVSPQLEPKAQGKTRSHRTQPHSIQPRSIQPHRTQSRSTQAPNAPSQTHHNMHTFSLQAHQKLSFEVHELKAALQQYNIQNKKMLQHFNSQVQNIVAQQNESTKKIQSLAQDIKRLKGKTAEHDIKYVSLQNMLKQGFKVLKASIKKLTDKSIQNQTEHNQHIERMAEQYNQLLNHCNEQVKKINKVVDRHNVQLAGHADYLKHAHKQIKTIQHVEARAQSCEKF